MTHLARTKNQYHGLSSSKIYKRWSGIKTRCYKKTAANYKHYGGKGIKICDEWLNFINFYNWAILNGYGENLEIDRIDNNKDYCPENCRIVNRAANIRNSSITKYSWVVVDAARDIYKSKKISMHELSRVFGMSYSNMSSILNNETWVYEPQNVKPPIHDKEMADLYRVSEYEKYLRSKIW